MTDARPTAVEPSHHHGFFRIHPTNDRIRPWVLDDGTENGWKANVAWVDVEPTSGFPSTSMNAYLGSMAMQKSS
jgi:hypothetical protein